MYIIRGIKWGQIEIAPPWWLVASIASYWDGWEAVLSGLLSCPAGGLLFHGLLFPSAGELVKSSSSSRPFVASYCVFSSRVIRRSSSSPNSPPIRVGSPTTITSGTWLVRVKLLAGLRFLPPALLPRLLLDALLAEFFLFLLLVVVCRVGSFLWFVGKISVLKFCGCPAGGATILCHFWNKQVFKQSLGLRLYVLCRDINSCIGSRMTHNLR